MKYIVRYAKKYCRYKYETFDIFQEAWDRYNQLDEDEFFRISFISPANDDIAEKILKGEDFYNKS